jgi:hypothetical protein
MTIKLIFYSILKGKTLIEIEMGFVKEAKPLLDRRRDSYAVGLP